MDPAAEGSRGLTLPGYKYLGPLNSLNRGLPTNKLDAAAKRHDEQYHKITDYYKKTKNYKEFEKQVREADLSFLEEVKEFTPETTYDQVASWLATGGIGTKYLLEQVTGVIYPTAGSESSLDIANMETFNANSMIGGGVENNANVHKFQFKKKFTFAIESTKATYTKDKSNTTYKTYIHSLPWQYLYFYLTEKEYKDMCGIFHTSKVTGVGIKITNLGNRTTFVTSASAVNFANANSQTTIGIWEHLERTMPVQMGNGIKSETLYGKSIGSLAEGENKDPEHSTAQAKIITNIISYKISNAQKNLHLPPLIMEAKVLFNATNSIGPIYEKSYTPQDGTFHTKHDGITNENAYMMRMENIPIQMTTSGQTQAISLQANLTKAYDSATVDNMVIGNSLFTNAKAGFMPSIGVGIIPLLNADGSLEKSVLNIMVETYINLECVSHGTNLLMASGSNAQPNTNFMKMSVNKKWTDKYTIQGAPVMESLDDMQVTPVDMAPVQEVEAHEVHEPEPEPAPEPARAPTPQPEPEPAPTPQQPAAETPPVVQQPAEAAAAAPPVIQQPAAKPQEWYEKGERDEHGNIWVQAHSVPNQKRIQSNMPDEQKLLIAYENNNIRIGVQQALRNQGIHIRFTGKNTPMGIPVQGGYDVNDPRQRLAIIKVGTARRTIMQRQLEEEIAKLEAEEKKRLEAAEAAKKRQETPSASTSVQAPKQAKAPAASTTAQAAKAPSASTSAQATTQAKAPAPEPSPPKQPEVTLKTMTVKYKTTEYTFVIYTDESKLAEAGYAENKWTIHMHQLPKEDINLQVGSLQELWSKIQVIKDETARNNIYEAIRSHRAQKRRENTFRPVFGS